MLWYTIILIVILILLFYYKNLLNKENYTNNIIPIFIEEYNIFDILHNDEELIIISTPLLPLKIQYYSNNELIDFIYIECPYKHSSIYYLKMPYNQSIELIINNKHINTNVNKYPEFRNEIIMSTLVKDEDDYIKQWIDYHSKLGVDRFVIYDNSDKNTLNNILSEYNNKVVLIKWKYQYDRLHAQQTSQTHCIYAFNNSKYIGLFDIDEYVNIQHEQNIPDFFQNIISEHNINIEQISSFRFLNKDFYNPDSLPTDGNKFLYIPNCEQVTKEGREKNFIIPKNVSTFSVHMVTSGKPMYTLEEKDAFFNHYCYLNKPDRCKNKTTFTDNSILVHIQHFITNKLLSLKFT